MTKKEKESEPELLPEINIGTCGHVDHGKTTLTYALTGRWTMLHSEEVKRGITIRLGYADADIRKCPNCPEPDCWTAEKDCPRCKSKTELIKRVSFVDAPGHETLMAVMLSGAAIIDGALLVVAANEEFPQPQTAEHLMALKVLEIKNIIIVQNKVDLVPKEKALENYQQIKEYVLKNLGFEPVVIPVSAQRKVNVDLLISAIQELFKPVKREEGKEPLMLIARSFDINKPGTGIEKLTGGVLGGSIVSGKFSKGDKIEIRPGIKIEKRGGQVVWKPVLTSIQEIFCASKPVAEKGPGGTVAFSTTLDPAITKADAFVGNVVGLSGKLPPVVESLTLEPHLFEYVLGTKEQIKLEPFKQYEPLMLSIGTATTIGIIQQAGKALKFNLKRPVCVQKGQKVAIGRQVQNRWHLIGYGIVL